MLTEEDKQWINERFEKVETKLLTEFHKSTSPVELRQRSHAAAIKALDAEDGVDLGPAQESGRPLTNPFPPSVEGG
jgi:hypothetical protein